MAENGAEALSYLYSEEGITIDAVVTDVHMPALDGFELLKHVTVDFPNVPVFLMSADDRPHTMIRGLNSGAVLFMHKPVSAAELKNIWQFVYHRTKSDTNKPIIVDDNEKFKHSVPAAAAMQIGDGIPSSVETGHLGNEEKPWRMCNTRCVQHNNRRTGEAVYNVPSAVGHVLKNRRLVWTAELHYKFLYALHMIGVEQATPKAIHEVMNVVGVTRSHVASHWQKYRLFLKRSEDMANGEGVVFPRSSFTSTYRAGYVPLYYRLLHIDPTDQSRLIKMSQEDLTAMREPCYTVPSHRYNFSGVTNYSTFRLESSSYYSRHMPSHFELDSRLAATHQHWASGIGRIGVTWNAGNHPMAYKKVELEGETDELAQLQIDTPIELHCPEIASNCSSDTGHIEVNCPLV